MIARKMTNWTRRESRFGNGNRIGPPWSGYTTAESHGSRAPDEGQENRGAYAGYATKENGGARLLVARATPAPELSACAIATADDRAIATEAGTGGAATRGE